MMRDCIQRRSTPIWSAKLVYAYDRWLSRSTRNLYTGCSNNSKHLPISRLIIVFKPADELRVFFTKLVCEKALYPATVTSFCPSRSCVWGMQCYSSVRMLENGCVCNYRPVEDTVCENAFVFASSRPPTWRRGIIVGVQTFICVCFLCICLFCVSLSCIVFHVSTFVVNKHLHYTSQ